MRWLLDKFEISPNAYYNYLKHRKAEYPERSQETLDMISEIYRERNCVPGYRMMKAFLEMKGIKLSCLTVYKYMKELDIRSVVRRKRPAYRRGECDKVFPNSLNRDFYAEERNLKWCTDFTFLRVAGDERFCCICTVLDLCGRYVVAGVTSDRLDTELAIRALRTALDRNPTARGRVTLHSDQGTQFTSKAFAEFCEHEGVKQSMSHAGCPFDNAPMERYFNTLKNEFTDLYSFESPEELYAEVENFAYVYYNHVRPHSSYENATPFKVRMST